jgi:branched-chain amino acid aminotransferase
MLTRAVNNTVQGLRRCYSEISVINIQTSRIVVQRTQNFKQKPVLDETLKFGSATTDHMLTIDWTESSGWASPTIHPYSNISLDPCSSVLHYGLECFEGLKAYKTPQGRISMFRPEMNMDRLSRSAEALALPVFLM